MRELRPWSQFAIAGLATAGLVALVQTYADLELRWLADDIASFRGISDPDLPQRIDALRQWAAVAQIVAMFCTAAPFFIWHWRAKSNASDAGAIAAGCTPGMAVLAWFIPVMNLWRPFHAVRESLQESRWMAFPDRDDEPPGRIVSVWWAAMLSSSAVGIIGAVWLGARPTADSILSATPLLIAGHLAKAVAALVLIVIVRWITALQARAARAAAAVPPPIPASA